LHDAFNCAGGTDNPFVSLRLGQAYFELNVIDKAEEYLMRAYMLDGKKIFRGEPKKYVNHLKKTFDI
jgi:hypothetical protein